MNLDNYPADNGLRRADRRGRQAAPGGRVLFDYLAKLRPAELNERRAAVDAAIMTMGITFTVYSDGANIDRAWPFDIIPRIIAARRVAPHRAGLKQRLTALNLFIDDLYHEQTHRQGRRVSAPSPRQFAATSARSAWA